MGDPIDSVWIIIDHVMLARWSRAARRVAVDRLVNIACYRYPSALLIYRFLLQVAMSTK